MPSCTATDRSISPLSSNAVKPWSAMKRTWSTGSLPAEASNMPIWGANLSRNLLPAAGTGLSACDCARTGASGAAEAAVNAARD